VFLVAAMPKSVNKARVACLDFSLQKAKMKLGVSVVIDDPAKLAAIRDRSVRKVTFSFLLLCYGFTIS
jgi:chaperonin GroEL (HSP60 family)